MQKLPGRAASIALIVLTLACSAASDTWVPLSVQQCLLEDTAMDRSTTASSERHCTFTASEKSAVGALVAQFNQLTLKCALFLFQSVCRQMVAGQSPDCRVFLRFPVNPQLISAKLSSLWLGDSMSRFDNLVCQSDADMNRLYPVGAGPQWGSSYGAQLDARAGYLMTKKGNLDFLGGIAWLVRLKRQPQLQPYLVFVNCNETDVLMRKYTELWEWSTPCALYAATDQVGGITWSNYYSPALLANSSEDWIDVGFTMATGAGVNASSFYYNGAFIPKGSVTISDYGIMSGAFSNGSCLLVGRRTGFNYWFNGTVRAIGVFNASLTESEIRQFFSMVK